MFSDDAIQVFDELINQVYKWLRWTIPAVPNGVNRNTLCYNLEISFYLF